MNTRRHPAFRLRRFASFLLLATVRLPAATSPEPADAIPPLFPPRGEMPPTFWEHHGWTAGLGGGGLLVLAGLAVWFLCRPRPVALVPPEVQARRALESLCRQPENGLVLSLVSQALRQYVAAAFGLTPDQLTTTEFCRALDASERVGPGLAAAVGSFLRQCDERKFAPSVPPTPLRAATRALELVVLAEARRVEVAPAASPPPAASVDKAA